jgi:hypothetical protein
MIIELPERLLALGNLAAPTAREVAPRIAVIERLWDDPQFEAASSRDRQGRATALRWRLARQAV